MKLRKALERAKNERNECGPEFPGAGGNGNSNVEDCWKAPVYSDSTECFLNPAVVEKNRGVCLRLNPEEIERYKILRTRIKHLAVDRPMKTIMVTSPNKGEGKTVTCINMGLTFARDMKQTVLLVDCDFKGQDIHRYLGINSQHSLIDYFLYDTPVNDLIIWPGVEKLTLISGDRTIVDASELLSSGVMADLVKEMANRYDDRYVFFDAPPVLEQSEAISMAPLMDGILMVVEAGRTSKKDVQAAVALLPKEKFLGFVLNKQES